MAEPPRRPDLRPFRMQDGPPIPWFIAEAIYRHIYRHTGQTLERLNERGGFGWSEVAYMWGTGPAAQGRGGTGTNEGNREQCVAQVRRAFDVLVPVEDVWEIVYPEDETRHVVGRDPRINVTLRSDTDEFTGRVRRSFEIGGVHAPPGTRLFRNGVLFYAQPDDPMDRRDGSLAG